MLRHKEQFTDASFVSVMVCGYILLHNSAFQQHCCSSSTATVAAPLYLYMLCGVHQQVSTFGITSLARSCDVSVALGALPSRSNGAVA